MTSRLAEAGIRDIVRCKLGSAVTITGLKQENDVVYLDVVPPDLEKAVLNAVCEIPKFMENESITVVRVNNKHVWRANVKR